MIGIIDIHNNKYIIVRKVMSITIEQNSFWQNVHDLVQNEFVFDI